MKRELSKCYCDECGTDLGYWCYRKKKKAYIIDNGDMFCSKKCFNKYCLSFWNLKEVKHN